MSATNNLRMTNTEISKLPKVFREAMSGLEAKGLIRLNAITSQVSEIEICNLFAGEPFAIVVNAPEEEQ